MTKILRDAIAKVETLPQPVQDRIAQELSDYVDKLNALRADLQSGIHQLDAGEGKEIDFDGLMRKARSDFHKA
jgi:hypothetical protein